MKIHKRSVTIIQWEEEEINYFLNIFEKPLKHKDNWKTLKLKTIKRAFYNN